MGRRSSSRIPEHAEAAGAESVGRRRWGNGCCRGGVARHGWGACCLPSALQFALDSDQPVAHVAEHVRLFEQQIRLIGEMRQGLVALLEALDRSARVGTVTSFFRREEVHSLFAVRQLPRVRHDSRLDGSCRLRAVLQEAAPSKEVKRVRAV